MGYELYNIIFLIHMQDFIVFSSIVKHKNIQVSDKPVGKNTNIKLQFKLVL